MTQLIPRNSGRREDFFRRKANNTTLLGKMLPNIREAVKKLRIFLTEQVKTQS